jgi:CRISPR-associated protein Cas1
LACRDAFRQSKLLQKIIPMIEQVLAAGDLVPPSPPEEAVAPAIPLEKGLGDAGHRY